MYLANNALSLICDVLFYVVFGVIDLKVLNTCSGIMHKDVA